MASSGLFARFLFCALLCAAAAPVFAEGEPEGEADLVDSLVVDVDSDGEADRGDTIEYRVMLRSTGTRAIEGAELTIPLGDGLTLVPDSLLIGPIVAEDTANQNIADTSVIPVLTNDRDIDGVLQPGSVTVVQMPTAGTTTVDPNTGDISYTSTAAAWPDVFTYTVADDDGLVSSEVQVSVYVNTCPVAEDDAVSVGESAVLNGDLFVDNGNGADSDADSGAFRFVAKVNGMSAVTGTDITLASGAILRVGFFGDFTYDTNGSFESLVGLDEDTDSFTYEISDGYCTATATVTVTIDGANDCPVAKADAITTDEDTAAMGNVLSDNGSGADSDADTGATLTISEVNGAAGDVGMTIALGSGAQLTLNAGGTFTYDPNGAFDALSAGQDDTDSFTYTVSDGTCSDTATATITINGVNDAPTAAAKSANGLGNLELVGNTGGLDASATASPAQTASVSLLTGAADVDTASGSLSVVPATGMSTKGGGFAVFADGSFLYTAPAGLANTTDTFPYTITDGSANSSAATVTVTLGNLVWFINNSAGGSGGTGTSADPFLTTADFNAANGGGVGRPATGERIYLDAGAGNYTSGITLLDNQVLEGEGVALVLGMTTLVPAGSSPTITSTINNGVTLGSGNTLRGFNVADTPGFFKISGAVAGSLTANSIALTGTGGAIRITTSAAFGSNVTFSTLESTSSPGAGIDLTGVTGTLGITSSGMGIAATADGSPAINVSGGSVSFTYSGGVSKSNNGALVNVSGHSSGTLLFQTTALSATNGTGLQFDNADGTYTFNSTVTLNGGDAGIDITNGSAGNFTFSDAPITEPVGAGLVISGGGGTISHAGAISKSSAGRLIFIQARTGGTIGVSGNLSSTSLATGMLLQNNSGGVHTFSGNSKTLTTSSIGLTMSNCTGSTTNFTNGGLVITTSSGIGISASNAGTLTVIGAGNSTTAVGGAALDIDNATFTGTFATLTSTNSTAQGLDLSNLLAASSLVVTGMTTVTSPTTVGIAIDDVEAGSTLIFGNVGVTNRGSHGIFIRDFDGASMLFGDADISNGLSAGGNGVYVQTSGGGATSTGAITFSSLDISNTNATVNRADAGADGIPDNETDDGHGVRLMDHTGDFTVTGDGTQSNGGTIQNIEGDGFSLIRSGGLNLDEIVINNIGTANQAASTVDNAGIYAYNLIGTSAVTNSTISRFQDGNTGGGASRGVSITNDGVNFTSFTSTDTTYFNDSSLLGDDGIQVVTSGAVSGALIVNSAFNLGNINNGSDFFQISGTGVQVIQNGSGTLTTTISDSTFRDTITPGGFGGLDFASVGSGVMSTTVDECLFLDLYPGGVNNSGVITFFAGGTVNFDGMVNNCTFGSASQRTSDGRGAIRASTDLTGAVTDFDITITNNTIDDTAREAISILPRGPAVPAASGQEMDIVITGNIIGSTTPVANDAGLGREGIEIVATDDAKIVNVLLQSNTVTNFVDSSSDESVDIDANDNTTINATVLGNTFNQSGSAGTADSIDVATMGVGSPSLCLDMNSANTSPNSCPHGIVITESAGTFSIEDIGGAAIPAATVDTFIEARNTGSATVTGTFDSCDDH